MTGNGSRNPRAAVGKGNRERRAARAGPSGGGANHSRGASDSSFSCPRGRFKSTSVEAYSPGLIRQLLGPTLVRSWLPNDLRLPL